MDITLETYCNVSYLLEYDHTIGSINAGQEKRLVTKALAMLLHSPYIARYQLGPGRKDPGESGPLAKPSVF